MQDFKLSESYKRLLGKLYSRIPKPTKEQYKKILYDTEISLREMTMLQAIQTLRAIDRLSMVLDKYELKDIKKYNAPYFTWQDTPSEEFDKAMDHLNLVCTWHLMNTNHPYLFEWLKDYEQAYYESIRERFKKKNTKFKKFEISEDF
jgi:hypothetical protein